MAQIRVKREVIIFLGNKIAVGFQKHSGCTDIPDASFSHFVSGFYLPEDTAGIFDAQLRARIIEDYIGAVCHK